MGVRGVEEVGGEEGEERGGNGRCVVFFFEQETAYEVLRSLLGSEMCIRDRPGRLGR